MKIVVTRKIPQKGLQLLIDAGHELDINEEERALTKEEILEKLADAQGLLCLLTDAIDKELIDSAPQLKMISNYAVGYNNIDVSAATEHKIPVSNTPDVLTDATAEHAWALLFASARRIQEGDGFTREGRFKGWEPLLMMGQDISNKTLGIIGAGRIGTAFALKSRGFDMTILYHSNHSNTTLDEELDARQVDLHTLLKESDFISIHCPLTSQTHHLIGKEELALMKTNAVIVNTARGAVIDERALIDALKTKQIFSAGLDVYEHEPQIPQALLELDNVVLAPHNASATVETRTKMAVMAAEDMLLGLKGIQPQHCVNPEIFDSS